VFLALCSSLHSSRCTSSSSCFVCGFRIQEDHGTSGRGRFNKATREYMNRYGTVPVYSVLHPFLCLVASVFVSHNLSFCVSLPRSMCVAASVFVCRCLGLCVSRSLGPCVSQPLFMCLVASVSVCRSLRFCVLSHSFFLCLVAAVSVSPSLSLCVS